MKIRSDFVSNSSSCSFVIEKADVMKCFKAMTKFKDLDVPYEVSDELYVYCAIEDADRYNKALEIITEILPEYVIEHSYKPIEKTLDATYFDASFYMKISNLIELANHEKSKNLFKLIDNVSFHVSEDYGTCVIYLSMFNMFFVSNGCNPNTYESERDFMDLDSVKFFATLFNRRTK